MKWWRRTSLRRLAKIASASVGIYTVLLALAVAVLLALLGARMISSF